MTYRSIVNLFLVLSCVAAISLTTDAQKNSSKKTQTSQVGGEQPLPRGSNIKEGASQATKGAKVLGEIMSVPDKGIPTDLLNKAECIAVFPAVIKAGFIFSAKAGRGLASCRTKTGWSAPAYLEIKGGGFGLQAGGQSTDVVLLFMNTEGLKKLLTSKVELGADSSIAAGPVGREAAASTDASMSAEILSYSRSKGVFAGISLKGSVITPKDSDMKATYGGSVSAKQVLEVANTRAPEEVQVFAKKLGEYSNRKAN